MNRIIGFFIFILFLCNSVLAVEEEAISKDLKIVKKDGFYCVVDKTTLNNVVPCEYKKIKKLGLDSLKAKTKNNRWKILTINNEEIFDREFDKVKISKIDNKKDFTLENTIFYGIYKKNSSKNNLIYIKSYNYSPENFLEEYFNQNNKISKINFNNYPKIGTIILNKDNKFGYLSAQKDYFIYLPPKFENIYIPDNETSVFKLLGISYSDIEDIKVFDKYYWYNIKPDGKTHKKIAYLTKLASPFVKQDIKIEEDKIILNFKGINNSYKNISLTAFPDKKENYFGVGQIKSDLKNYITVSKDKIEISDNKKVYTILKKDYDDFYFQDSNTIIYNVKNISFSNPNRIFAKKNGLWGIIDKNQNVIADFQYEDIKGFQAEEEIELKEDNKKYDLKYKNVNFPKKNIFLVKKGKKYGLIDINGEVLAVLGSLLKVNTENEYRQEKIEPSSAYDLLSSKPFKLNIPMLQDIVLSNTNNPVVQKVLDKLY